MTTNIEQMKQIVEAGIMAASEPISAEALQQMFSAEEIGSVKELKVIIDELIKDYQGRGIELKEVASGYRFQVRTELAPWLSRLTEEKPPRYSRALLETLALVAYKQPITRAEIEEIRGVAVSTNIFRTLQEREWVKVVGHKDAPGKPALYATTKQFLDYFNLKSLAELPSLAELQSLEKSDEEIQIQLMINNTDTQHPSDTGTQEETQHEGLKQAETAV